ncbi:hypothetical protein CEE45_08520 [Candidatus Heimdallarchaeota archaeon B3_Heim]|nr:MAG: hypothetical protein CEE45_08520 [Candidatus Heimdallarchaeota archaeon B3_Heim]
MISGNFVPTAPEMAVAGLLWTFLFANSLAYLINGLLVRRSFNTETQKKAAEGFPVDSLEGFSSVTAFTKQVLLNSGIIAGVIFLSWILMLTVVMVIPFLQNNDSINDVVIDLTGQDFSALEGAFLRPILIFSAIGLVLIAIGILLLLKIPEKPSFEVGAFLKYYYPRQTPLILDNLLSDAVLAFLDPITKMRFDEWTESIRSSLNPSFEYGLDLVTRVERAREKILLLFYLKKRMPILLPMDSFKSEITEVIHENKYNQFSEGGNSGITFAILTDIFNQLSTRIPEVFMTIDRLIIELTDNLEDFLDNKDLWVNVSAPEKVVGNENPFRFLMFALNKDVKRYRERKRMVDFKVSGTQKHFMEDLSISVPLDEAEEIQTESHNLEFISEGSQDILGLVTQILQIGDATWFTVERKEFSSHLFHLSISEKDRGSIFAETISVDVTRDLMFYVRTYGGKLSALSGLLLPLGSIVLQYLPF